MLADNDIQTEIFVDSTDDGPGWYDITSRVRYATGIEIRHGSRGIQDGIPEPSECRMTWDCRDGLLWPGNPMSDYYGSLDVNTPLRVALGLIDHTFPGTVVDDWSPVGGYPVVNTGSGGTVADSDWQQTPGVGTHSVPVTNAYRQTVLDGFDLEDCEQSIEFMLPFGNTTGAAVEPANLIFRYIDGVSHHLVRVVVNADETITVKWKFIEIGVGEFDLTDVYTATIIHAGQWVKVKANMEGTRLQAKIWDPDDPEPIDWLINEAPGLFQEPTGSIGIRSGIASGNTNTKPIVFSYRNWTVRSLCFHGEISTFPLEVDVSGNEMKIPIVAAGTTRKLMQGTPPTLSALRRAIPLQDGLQQYWALEDKRGSGRFGSALAGHPPMIPLTGVPGYAEYSDLPSSQALPTGNGSDWHGVVPEYTDTGDLQVSFVLHLPAGGQTDFSILCRWYTDHPSAKLWQLIYRTGGDLQLQAWNSETNFVYASSVLDTNCDDSVRLISVQLSNNGADVDWAIRALRIGPGAGGTSLDTGTATGLQIASAKSVGINLNLTDTPAFGHVFVQSVLTDLFEMDDEGNAWNLEFRNRRLERLLIENGYQCTLESAENNPYDGTDFMGEQEPGTLPALLEECLIYDTGGMWFDGKSHDGIMNRDRTALCEQDVWFTLSYAGRQLQPEWQPTFGDRTIRNRSTVSRRDGAEATYELETGPKSVAAAGVYPSDVAVNAYNDQYLQQIAAWRVAMGTIDEPVYPAAVVELAAPAVAADPSIANRLLDLKPGRIFHITDAESVFQFGPARLMCVGYTVRLFPTLRRYELIGEPASPYNAFELEHPERGQLDSGSSTLTSDISSSATSFQVSTANPGDLWTTSATWFPLDIEVGGEQITLSSISGASSPQTFTVATNGRHVNNVNKSHKAGAEVHIYNDPRWSL